MGKHRDSKRHVFETRLPNTGMDWDDMAEIEKAKDVIYFKGRAVPTTTMFVRDAVRFYCGYLINKYNICNTPQEPHEQPPQAEDTYNE
jgi:hypothetical protein